MTTVIRAARGAAVARNERAAAFIQAHPDGDCKDVAERFAMPLASVWALRMNMRRDGRLPKADRSPNGTRKPKKRRGKAPQNGHTDRIKAPEIVDLNRLPGHQDMEINVSDIPEGEGQPPWGISLAEHEALIKRNNAVMAQLVEMNQDVLKLLQTQTARLGKIVEALS